MRASNFYGVLQFRLRQRIFLFVFVDGSPHSCLWLRVPLLVVCGVVGVFVGVVVSFLGRSVDALVLGADEGRGRPR